MASGISSIELGDPEDVKRALQRVAGIKKLSRRCLEYLVENW